MQLCDHFFLIKWEKMFVNVNVYRNDNNNRDIKEIMPKELMIPNESFKSNMPKRQKIQIETFKTLVPNKMMIPIETFK